MAYNKEALENQLELCKKNINNIQEVIAKEQASRRELLGLLYASNAPDPTTVAEAVEEKDRNIAELERGVREEEQKIKDFKVLLEELED